MILAIHQPEYFPLARLLHKWAHADLLILLDDVQFDRSSLQHRAKLYPPGDLWSKARWLTIPYRHTGAPQPICEVRVADPDWPLYHWWRLQSWYRGMAASHLTSVEELLTSIVRTPAGGRYRWQVGTAAEHTFRWMGERASIQVPVMRASELRAPEGGWGEGSERLIHMCQMVGATEYLSGATAAQAYLDTDAFASAGIKVRVQRFTAPPGRPEPSGLHVYLAEGPEALKAQVNQA